MRILAFGDTHIHGLHAFSRPSRDAWTTRHHEHVACREWLAEIIRTRCPDLVVNGGDILHTQGQASYADIHVAVECEARIAYACRDVRAEYVVLLGNHEKLTDTGRYLYGTRWLRYMRHVILIDQAEVMNRVAFIPHTLDYGVLRSLPPAEIGFSHLDVRGARFHATRVDTQGMDPAHTPVPLLINHHYHVPQELSGAGARIVFPGAPQTWGFHEPQEGRGAIWIEGDKVERLYADLPRFLTVTPEQLPDTRAQDYLLVQAVFESDLEPYRDILAERQYRVQVQAPRTAGRAEPVTPLTADDPATVLTAFVDDEAEAAQRDEIKAVGLRLLRGVHAAGT